MKLYEGYLTEEKLHSVLNVLYPKGVWIRNKTVPESGRRFRPDFRNEHYKLIVEYDGHLHYTTAKGAFNDIIKIELFEDMGYNHFSIPYFIQIDINVYHKLFLSNGAEHIDALEFTDFKQGFISEKCFLPADFCTAGLLRFALEVDGKYNKQWSDILRSLEVKESELGVPLVNPLIPYCCFLNL